MHKSISQCDLNIYGIEITTDNQFTVKALNPSSGELSTSFDTIMEIGTVVPGSHVVMNDVFYTIDQTNDLYSFDLKQGALISQKKVSSKISSVYRT